MAYRSVRFLYVRVYTTCVPGTHGGQKAASNPLELELRVVSYHMDFGSRQEHQALSHLSSPNMRHLTLKMLAKANTIGNTCISS